LLGLSIGAAVLLGGILAPTDPVLASDVQVKDPKDRDRLRLTLTAEAGLNDGTAFPFVMLGLGLLGLRDLGDGAWRWWLIDGLWAVGGGLAIGGAIGYGIGRLVLHLNARRRQPLAFGEYLLLGLIGLSYGAAVHLHAYGFLAVFATGVALRAVERAATGASEAAEQARSASGVPEHRATAPIDDPKIAPAYFAGTLLATNEQLERILEVALVLVLGAAVMVAGLAVEAIWFAPLLFLVIRPLAAVPLLRVAPFPHFEYGAIAWFGIRGIGSLYYLMFAIEQGLPGDLAAQLASLTLTIVACSILVHGVSVTPLLARYSRRMDAGSDGKTPRVAAPPSQRSPRD
jgi:sodium/hydrogen antiporter